MHTSYDACSRHNKVSQSTWCHVLYRATWMGRLDRSVMLQSRGHFQGGHGLMMSELCWAGCILYGSVNSVYGQSVLPCNCLDMCLLSSDMP